MADFREYIGVNTSAFIVHYGVGHDKGGHSGRYPWGSGKNPRQRRAGYNTTLTPKHSDSLHKSAISSGFKLLSESETLEQSLEKVNPYRGAYSGTNNCLSCSLSGYLRANDIDATAKSVLSKGGVKHGYNILEKLGNGRKVDDITLDKGETPGDVTKAIKELYGDNSSGLIVVYWKGGGGHVYNFDTTGGKVRFIDYQSGDYGKDVECYFDHVDASMPMHLFRLDDTDLDMNRMKKYVKA